MNSVLTATMQAILAVNFTVGIPSGCRRMATKARKARDKTLRQADM